MRNLLAEFIRLSLAEVHQARVPTQLIEPDDNQDSGKKQSKEQNEDEEIQEFSTVGGGAIAGYSLPLGANPDNYGRKKNSTKRKKS